MTNDQQLMTHTVNPTDTLLGEVALPADKSIAQRTALLASLGDGISRIVNYPSSADPQSALSCMRQLGIRIEADEDDILSVHGNGIHGLEAPSEPLDCGNSGTTMRLLCGILAGQPFDSVLIGDASLSKRPMERIANPLRDMGASIELTDGHAPIHIKGNTHLKGITYELPVPSAQVKSCVLLAGLFAAGETTVVETQPSRDHTERMLALDVVEMSGKRLISIQQNRKIPAQTWAVPRDFSAASFFLVAGSIVSNADLRLPGVGINKSRSALLDVLGAMGAQISIENERVHGGEPIADLHVKSAPLRGISLNGDLIPAIIDEVPVLAVAATLASGRTEIRDAGELRVKETDRIDAMVKNLRSMGVEIEEFEDGFTITGTDRLKGAYVDSFDDHRIAMAMGIAGLCATEQTRIKNAECAAVSFPGFWELLKWLCGES